MCVYICTHACSIFPCILDNFVLRFRYPDSVRNLLLWHVKTNSDYLCENPPNWFKSIVLIEVLLQFPFFFVAVWALYNKIEYNYRIGFCIYGAHVATTMVPILGEFLLNASLGEKERWTLVLIYIPYLIIPMMLLLQFSFNILTPIAIKKNN